MSRGPLRPFRFEHSNHFRRLGHWAIGVVVLFFLVSPAAYAQSAGDELGSLREEVRQLRDELAMLRALVVSGESSGRVPSSQAVFDASLFDAGTQNTVPGDSQLSSTALLPLIQAQVAEHARTKVESNSRMPVRLFGTILSNTFYNSGNANWLDAPNVVPAESGSGGTGSFSSTLRQTRIGAVIDGPDVGGFRTSGFFAMDFFGGVPGFRTGQTMGVPRLLYGFMRLDGEKTAFEIGQDLMPLAPRNPESLGSFSFPSLFYSGNLYFRVPQARVERAFNLGDADVMQLDVAIVAPVSGDLPTESFTFAPPRLPGEGSRRPALQARLAWRRTGPVPGEPHAEVGMSGHYGSERRSSGSVSSWATAFDFMLQRGRLSLQGEAWAGQNIDAFGGSVGQLAKSRGGFAEVGWTATPRLGFNSGFGIDSLFDHDRFAADISENASLFANAIYQFTPEFATSFEWRRLMTRRVDAAEGSNNHFNMAFAYSF